MSRPWKNNNSLPRVREDNKISAMLPHKVDVFLQDMAQTSPLDITYSDIGNRRFNPVEMDTLDKLAAKYFRFDDNNDEEEIEQWLETVAYPALRKIFK